MIKIMKPLAAGLVMGAFFLLSPGLSHAQSRDYCYNHPYDNSHYCFCYHHPRECNGAYRQRYSDWDRPPDWNSHPDWYRSNHPDWYRHDDQNHVFANEGYDHDRAYHNENHADHADHGHPVGHDGGGHPNNGHGGHPNEQH